MNVFLIFNFIKYAGVHNCKVQPTERWGKREVCCSGELNGKTFLFVFLSYFSMCNIDFAGDLDKWIFISLTKAAHN